MDTKQEFTRGGCFFLFDGRFRRIPIAWSAGLCILCRLTSWLH